MIWLLALLTGFVSLGSEVVFTRGCELLLGNTNTTVATVLATYLLGLAIGSLLAGRSSLIRNRPWTGFAVTQVILAILVVAVSHALPHLSGLRSNSGSTLSLAFVLTVLLLLLTSVAAGFAFPLLVVLLDRGRGRSGGDLIGRVYGLETFGAVVGALMAGFVLYRSFGLNGTAYLLSGCAGLAAVLALLVGRVAPAPCDDVVSGSEVAGSSLTPLASLALAGAAILGLELLWTRLLLFFIPGLVSALAAILAGILVGTAIGGSIGGWAARAGYGRRAGMACLYVAAAGVVLSLALLPYLADFIRWLPRPPHGGFRPGREMLVGFGVAAGLALVTTVGSGALLPLVTQCLGGPARTVAAKTYAWSSFGSVGGTIAAALVAGVWLSVRSSVAAAGFLLLAAALLLWRPGRDRWYGLVPAVVIGTLLAMLPRSDPMLSHSVQFRKSTARGRTILTTDQDSHVIASVVDMGPGQGRALYTNAFQAASTGLAYGYMRMLGHLPVLLARDPSRVLVIAYGTGTTVGSVSLHDSVRAIEIAELSPAVLRLASYFEEVNHGVPYQTDRGKNVAVRIGDGRSLVESQGDPFDVITLEPLPPNTPAAVHFYTSEFYQRCVERLTPGGVLCQWIPVYCADTAGFRSLVRTFASELETTWLFLFDQCVLLIGVAEPRAMIDVHQLLLRVAPAAIDRDLHCANMESAAAVLASFVAGRERLLEATAGDEIMSDDRPSAALEYARPNIEAIMNSVANIAFLHTIREDISPWLRLENLSSSERASLVQDLGRSSEAKSLLLKARSRDTGIPGQIDAALVQRALVLSPGDLEALDLLRQKPDWSVAALDADRGLARREIEAVLRAPGDDSARLERAIEGAGLTEGVDPLLLLPFLESSDLGIRMKAMVALKRLIGDIAPYDPAAPARARSEALESLRRRLRG